jgi:hypothetical protein
MAGLGFKALFMGFFLKKADEFLHYIKGMI